MNFPRDLSLRTLSMLRGSAPFRQRMLKPGARIEMSPIRMKLYAVSKGFVRLIAVQTDGTQTTRALLGKGMLFGDFPYAPRLYNKANEVALAHGPACVLEFDLGKVEDAALNNRDLQRLLVEILGVQLQLVTRRLQWQQTIPLEKRIELVLVDLLSLGGRPNPNGSGYALDVRMTHEELSEVVGAARPTVSAILSKLYKQQLISSTRWCACVRNLEGLTHLAEGTYRRSQ